VIDSCRDGDGDGHVSPEVLEEALGRLRRWIDEAKVAFGSQIREVRQRVEAAEARVADLQSEIAELRVSMACFSNVCLSGSDVWAALAHHSVRGNVFYEYVDYCEVSSAPMFDIDGLIEYTENERFCRSRF
jgi:hypothetical protein